MNHNPQPLPGARVCQRLDLQVVHKPKYEYLSIANFKRRYKKNARLQALQYTKRVKLIGYNCQRINFDPGDQIRINHPIIFGIAGSFLFHFFLGLFEFLRKKKFYYLKQEIFIGVYCVYLFYYVFIFKIENFLKKSTFLQSSSEFLRPAK